MGSPRGSIFWPKTIFIPLRLLKMIFPPLAILSFFTSIIAFFLNSSLHILHLFYTFTSPLSFSFPFLPFSFTFPPFFTSPFSNFFPQMTLADNNTPRGGYFPIYRPLAHPLSYKRNQLSYRCGLPGYGCHPINCICHSLSYKLQPFSCILSSLSQLQM
jgi:hypothetical protein